MVRSDTRVLLSKKRSELRTWAPIVGRDALAQVRQHLRLTRSFPHPSTAAGTEDERTAVYRQVRHAIRTCIEKRAAQPCTIPSLSLRARLARALTADPGCWYIE